MAEFKFACSHCGQNIKCDEDWGGQQITCPACAGSLVVPQLRPIATATPSPPAPATASGPRVAIRTPQAGPKSHKKAVAWSVGTIAFVVAAYFGIKLTSQWQAGFNKKADEMAKKSDGGEFGHVATLYKVLDATDPDKMQRGRAPASLSMADARAEFLESLKPKPDPTLALPLLPATWTLDVAAAEIPKGRVSGTSGGTDFHVETVKVDRIASAAVLTFQEGVGTDADHELLIYLPPSATGILPARSWTVTKEMKGKDAPQIVKRWTQNPKFAPVQKVIFNGYAMKLELDEPTMDWQPGRIFIALPDTNQTVLAGEFSIPVPRPEPTGVLRE